MLPLLAATAVLYTLSVVLLVRGHKWTAVAVNVLGSCCLILAGSVS